MITIEQLAAIMPLSSSVNRTRFIKPLNDAMAEFSINTPDRMAAFLAQVAHESGSLLYVEEIASGDAYDTRVDLGNTPQKDGDGRKYKGRGLIQVTGAANYRSCGKALQLDLMNHPEKLCEPVNAARSAAWFWSTRGCNKLADAKMFAAITKRINGGQNGAKERMAFFSTAQRVLV